MSRQFPQKVKRSGPASHDSRLSRRHHHQYRHTSSQGGIKYIQTDTLENDILSDQIDVLGTGIEKEKDEEEEEEHPDLLACRPCELVFAQAWGLKDHQIRGCPVDEPPARRCKREDDGVEGTYGYELECYLKGLPATVCCADELPTQAAAVVARRRWISTIAYMSILVMAAAPHVHRQYGHVRPWRKSLDGVSLSLRGTRRIFRFAGKPTGNVSSPFRQRPDCQRTAIILLFVSIPTL